MVYDINSTSASITSRVTGIQMWYQNNPKIYYNSVCLTGTGTNKFGSAALYLSQSITNAEVKNNIFLNTRDESPYCASSIGSRTPLASITSDYNDLYYEPTQYNCLVKVINTDYHTLVDWQAVGKDFHSLDITPCFSANDLHIDGSVATCLESRGTPITGCETDFDGNPRHAFLPDIGADEFDGLIPTGAVTAGAYSVGTNGFFSSIETIFSKLKTDGIAGPVALELTDNLYSAPTDEYGFKLDGPIAGVTADNRITIKPAENKNVIIEGNGLAAMTFLNSRYLTIDGVALDGPTTLTVHSQKNTAYVCNDGIDFLNNSDHNVLQNIIFICEDNTRTGGSGFYCTSGGTGAPDSNIIQNNFVKKSGYGFFIQGSSSSLRAKDNIIRGNQIGSETDSLIALGIVLSYSQNGIIEDNVVQNLKVTTGLSDKLQYGINIYFGLGDVIRNNVVHNLKANDGYTTAGILLSGWGSDIGKNNMVYNNMVYNIQSTSQQYNSRVSGIELWSQINTQIFHNSVYLSGTGANKFGSAALYVFQASGNLDIRNNIFVNTRDESPYCASAIYDHYNANRISDYNDLYYVPYNNNCLVRVNNTKYYTLGKWQATGQDLHSETELPNFNEPYLHINKNIGTYLESRGTPIAGMFTDFDGDARNATFPDIGADEFDGFTVGVEDESTLPIEFALIQNYPNPFNPTTKIQYSIPQSSNVVIKVFNVLGREIEILVNSEKSPGTYVIEWSAADLPSGVYFYQLQAGDYTSVKKMILMK
jgi:hypothetical protein